MRLMGRVYEGKSDFPMPWWNEEAIELWNELSASKQSATFQDLFGNSTKHMMFFPLSNDTQTGTCSADSGGPSSAYVDGSHQAAALDAYSAGGCIRNPVYGLWLNDYLPWIRSVADHFQANP